MTLQYLITGGAGFIGSNLAAHLIKKSAKVTIFDNLSRNGVKSNLDWLEQTYGPGSFRVVFGDVRDAELVAEIVKPADVVIHLAGQVAVTTSVENPRYDFEVNALGSINILEAVRHSKKNPILLYASTNKVYGGMEDIQIAEDEGRYFYKDLPNGIPEEYPLNFHSPYGCSKGCADQYFRDYARIYGLRTVVFRQSCIYGPRQFGIEDQGWLAWFIIAALSNRPITIYGNGKQVRDILFVDDLINAYESAINKIDQAAGNVYNIGGGVKNSISIWVDFKPILESLLQKPVQFTQGNWRPGDQRIYVSDIEKVKRELDWKPEMGVQAGINHLFYWVKDNLPLINSCLGMPD